MKDSEGFLLNCENNQRHLSFTSTTAPHSREITNRESLAVRGLFYGNVDQSCTQRLVY
jgi:hypothetical protein